MISKKVEKAISSNIFCLSVSILNSLLFDFAANNVGGESFLQNKTTNNH